VEEYDKKARKLADLFHENFKKLGDQVPPEATKAGPK
jgi:ATP-dependent phosphoenolpyruvate carboxykinase